MESADSYMVFKDRVDAAQRLAKKLEWLKKEDPIILAIPRGGVVTGDVISSELGVKLDIIVSRKVVAPSNPELAIGAVTHDGSYFPNVDITRMLNIPQKYIDAEISVQMKEIERRLMRFRGSKEYHLKGRTVVLVDDGIATGATMFVAIQWVKKQKPKQLIVAVPVGPKETIDKLNEVADKVVVLQSPVYFNAVGEFYQEFNQVDDYQVQEIMSKHGYKIQIFK
ncbi:MAG TPA: phosphoribosyltransferase family protein [Nitrosopumilaceae archaeon]|nr:phosphoribosyltransferase family protein [Nitrosopumilaceae archaeon]